MKICAACNEELPRESFSKKQWQMRQYQRRCKGCIDAGRAVPLHACPTLEEPTPPTLPTAAADDKAASCWLCLDEGADELGQPLRRDCSCRGDTASFAHLSCLVEYAKHKSDGRCLFIDPWTSCPQCLQPYQNELAVELATELVSFVEEQHQGDQSKFLAALDAKLDALPMQQAHHEEKKQIANKIVSTIESMKVADASLSRYVRGIEARVYVELGMIHYFGGTKEGARVAMEHFEKAQGIYKEFGLGALMESNIAAAKLCHQGDGHKKEELITESQQLYEQCVAEYGEVHHETVIIGMSLAIALREGNRSMEAEKLLAKLLVTCKLLHGPDHELTKVVETRLHECVRANQTQAQLC